MPFRRAIRRVFSRLRRLMGNYSSTQHAHLDYQARVRLAHRASLARESNVHSNAIPYYTHRPSPFARLPLELLTDIFLRVYDLRETEGLEYEQPSPHHAPLLLTRICRSWRLIALKMHQLWESIDVPLSMSVDTLNLWLENTRSIRLAITFSLHGHHMKAALEHIHKWSSFQFTLAGVTNDPNIGFYASYLEYDGVPEQLKTLIVTFGPRESRDNPLVLRYQSFLESLAHRALELTRVEWTTPWCHFKNETLPWSRLTHLVLRSPLLTAEMAYRILFTVPSSLIEFDVQLRLEAEPSINSAYPVLCLEKLTKLYVGVESSMSLAAFLPKISTPVLKNLHLHITRLALPLAQRSRWPHAHLIDLLSRSGKPPVRKMILQIPSEGLCPYLRLKMEHAVEYLVALDETLKVFVFPGEVDLEDELGMYMQDCGWIEDERVALDVYPWSLDRRAYYRY